MSYLFIVRHNNTYIGTMVEQAAHMVAEAMCVKVGDVVTLEQDRYQDDYNYSYDRYDSVDDSVQCCTLYHNGSDVVKFYSIEHNQWHREEESDMSEQSRKIHTAAYSKRLTGFKYNRSDARRGGMKSEQLTYIKRDMRRTERRVGKMLLKSEEV